MGYTVFNGALYMIGGLSGGSPQSKALKTSTGVTTNSWTQTATLPAAVFDLPLVVHLDSGGNLKMTGLGGFVGGFQTQTTVTSTDGATWIAGPTLDVPRARSTAVAFTPGL